MERLAIYPSLLILGGFAWFASVNEWWVLGGDAEAYYLAAERLVNGNPLYVSDGLYSQLYRYAPWFAHLFVPLTVLPKEWVTTGMAVLALGASVAVLWPLRRPSYATLALLLLIGPPLIHSAWLGNVQALMVAAVMYLPARSVWIGVAASLKGAPLALSIPDAREGRWRNVVVAVGMTVALVLPIVLYDLSDYPTSTALAYGFWGISPWLTVLAAVIGGTITWITRSPVFAAMTVILASPVVYLSYLSWLMVPLAQAGDRVDSHAEQRDGDRQPQPHPAEARHPAEDEQGHDDPGRLRQRHHPRADRV